MNETKVIILMVLVTIFSLTTVLFRIDRYKLSKDLQKCDNKEMVSYHYEDHNNYRIVCLKEVIN